MSADQREKKIAEEFGDVLIARHGLQNKHYEVVDQWVAQDHSTHELKIFALLQGGGESVEVTLPLVICDLHCASEDDIEVELADLLVDDGADEDDAAQPGTLTAEELHGRLVNAGIITSGNRKES